MKKIDFPIFEAGHPVPYKELSFKFPEFISDDIIQDIPVFFTGGDPALNKGFELFFIEISKYSIIPVIETIIPKNESIMIFLNSVINTINESYRGTKAVLKLHVGSSSEHSRKAHFGSVVSLSEISKSFTRFPTLINEAKPILVFDASLPFDAGKIATLFPPETFAIEIRKDQQTLDFFDDTSIRKLGYSIFTA